VPVLENAVGLVELSEEFNGVVGNAINWKRGWDGEDD